MGNGTDLPRVLWVTEEVPDRAGGGGSIRQAYLLEALATRFSVDLLVVGRVRDDHVRAAAASVSELPKPRTLWTDHPAGRRALGLAVALGSRYPLLAYLSHRSRRALARAISERRGRYQLVCVEHEALAPLQSRARTEPWIITLHALFSGIIERQLAIAGRPRQRWFWERDLRKAHRLERRALSGFDRSIVCSDEEAAALHTVGEDADMRRIAVIPNGVDLQRFRPSAVPPEPRVLFPATLSYPPNVDGALWFCSEVWPRVRAEVPAATLALAGREPVASVLALEQQPGITVHADVPSMVPYFESARVVIVPVRVGAGTRLKALEAMAVARPVVGTTIGLEGIAVTDGVHARIADGPEAFAASVVDILRHDDLARSLGEAGRAHVESQFGWDRIGERFVTVVSELLERNGAGCANGAEGAKGAEGANGAKGANGAEGENGAGGATTL